MHHHPRIIGFLGQGLSHEYGAVQQYLTQASLCALWGLEDWAVNFRGEAREELGHAELLSQQLLLMGIAPSAGHLHPSRPGADLRQMLSYDADMERMAVELYAQAESFAVRVRETDVAALFARLRKDEEGHLQHLQQTLAQMERAG